MAGLVHQLAVAAEGIHPEHVTITLSGAEILRLPDGPAKDFLIARLVQQTHAARRRSVSEAWELHREVLLEQEVRRLEASAQVRYVAMAAAVDAEYASRHRHLQVVA